MEILLFKEVCSFRQVVLNWGNFAPPLWGGTSGNVWRHFFDCHNLGGGSIDIYGIQQVEPWIWLNNLMNKNLLLPNPKKDYLVQNVRSAEVEKP